MSVTLFNGVKLITLYEQYMIEVQPKKAWLKRSLTSPWKVPSHLHGQYNQYWRRKKTHPAVMEMVANVLDVKYSSVQREYDTLRSDEKKFINDVHDFGNIIGIYTIPEHALAAYLVTRIHKPDVLVESGVNTGISSSYILKAMDQNGKGQLYSVDLPGTEDEPIVDSTSPYGEVVYDVHDSESDVGWRIPTSLCDRWNLHMGRSDGVMEPLLEEIGKIDVFLHDSEHSYENMIFEFEAAYPHLSDDGLVLSDDVDWNKSFEEFAQKKNVRSLRLDKFVQGKRKKQSNIVGISQKQ